MVLSELIAKKGITFAFTFKERKAWIASKLADFFYKNSRRGTLLYIALQAAKGNVESARKRLNNYQENVHLLHKLSQNLKTFKIGNKYLVNKIFKLADSWEIPLQVPRQIQDPFPFSSRKKVSPFNCKIKTSSKEIFHVITDDHEWSITPGKSNGKPFLSIYEAEVQLIKKGRLINNIAADCGVPWTHLIDIGSYMLISKAAEHFPDTWGRIVDEFHNFLTETISTGNDLGVHAHLDKSHLAAEKFEADRVWIKSRAKTWGELEGIGYANNPETKLGMVVAGKKLVEKYGQMADPDFRAYFFRAGKYATGSNFQQTWNSMKAVKMSGLSITSDALLIDGITESLGRPASETVYCAKLDCPWQHADIENEDFIIQALPVRTEDLSVYSVIEYARAYAKDPKTLERLIKTALSGNGFVISIDHDIEINSSSGGEAWDCLDPDKGDWRHLRNYLQAIKKAGVFQYVTTACLYGNISSMFKFDV